MHEDSCHPDQAPPFLIALYASFDYRQHYADLLARHSQQQQAIAELGLFHFWLARRAMAPHPADLPTASPGDGLRPVRVPKTWPLPLQLGDCDVQRELGGPIQHLIESRFDLYDRFCNLGYQTNDPKGVDAASLALGYQLFTPPPGDVLRWLRYENRRLFERLARAARGAA